MDLQALTLLVEIIDAGNLSEAARRLRTSRASISYRLKQFEKQIGQQLLRRTTRRLEPTEIGHKLYEYGRVIRDAGMAAAESISSLGTGPQGRVRIAVPSGYGHVVMTPWLLAFKRQYPGIILDVMFENRVADLLQGEVDLAVRVISQPPRNLVARDLGAVRYAVCAARSYADEHGLPTELEALGQLPIITSSIIGRQLRLAAYRGEERREVTLEPGVVSESILFLRDAIVGGLGVGIVPDYVMRDDIERGNVVTAFPEWRISIFGTQMYLLYMPNLHHTRAAAILIDYLLKAARAERHADRHPPVPRVAVADGA